MSDSNEQFSTNAEEVANQAHEAVEDAPIYNETVEEAAHDAIDWSTEVAETVAERKDAVVEKVTASGETLAEQLRVIYAQRPGVVIGVVAGLAVLITALISGRRK